MTRSDHAAAPDLRATLRRIAWLSIGLGLAVQLVSTAIALGHGNAFLPAKAVADALGRVSWSTLVCVGVAAGMMASGGAPAASGLAGLVAAPVAFGAAKGVQQSVATILGAGAGGGMALATLAAIGTLKAVEYGCLGLAIARFERQQRGSLRAYLGVGLALGLVFGTAIWAVSPAGALRPPSAALLTFAVNEVLFPAGCAMVLYGGNVVGRRLGG